MFNWYVLVNCRLYLDSFNKKPCCVLVKHTLLHLSLFASYVTFALLLRLHAKCTTSERKLSRLSSGPVMDMIGNLLRLHIMSIAPELVPISLIMYRLCVNHIFRSVWQLWWLPVVDLLIKASLRPTECSQPAIVV